MTTQTPPVTTVTVQLVHMDGPYKGRMDALALDRITLGRDHTCNVVFPAESRAVSRMHAEIVRDGSRFTLINHGRNGCFLNGKSADRVILKPGDIIQLAEGGPKLSFLTSTTTPSFSTNARKDSRTNSSGAAPSLRPVVPAQRSAIPPIKRPAVSANSQFSAIAITLQYSTNIKTFKKASVTLGREEGVDFIIKHPSVHKKHAEFITLGDRVGVRDISGMRETYVNHRVINSDTPLEENDIVMLGDHGPQLRHIGGGRFMEVIEDASPSLAAVQSPPDEIEVHRAFQQSPDDKSGFFKNLFKKL